MALQPYEVFLNTFVILVGLIFIGFCLVYAVCFIDFWIREWWRR